MDSLSLPILFFDTYIVDGIGNPSGSTNNTHRGLSVDSVRSRLPTYRYQKKIDVVKYTLASYSILSWLDVVIRFECEDPSQTQPFFEYCRSLFPDAKILNNRSSTAKDYVQALKTLSFPLDTWVFFSPNNDHPLIASPTQFISFYESALSFLKQYPRSEARLAFSHFTESVNDLDIGYPQWGYYRNVRKKLIYRDNHIIVTRANKVLNDSVLMFKLHHLLEIFSLTRNLGRVIRIEDTEFYIYRHNSSLLISPAYELCRHYDSYAHIIQAVPPLFIPNGFFQSNIRVRYGYDFAIPGWVNVNPLHHSISLDCDLPLLLDDIPYFWKSRISRIDVNQEFIPPNDKLSLQYYKNFFNPWNSRPTSFNLLRSFFVLITGPFRSTLRFITLICLFLNRLPSRLH